MASVADLVEPGTVRRSVDPAVWEAGTLMRDTGQVAIAEFGPLAVEADVSDQAEGSTYRVCLTADGTELRWTCECPNDDGGAPCAHFVAAALVSWERAPKRSS